MSRTFGFEVEFSESRMRHSRLKSICKEVVQSVGKYPFSESEGANRWTFKDEHCGSEFTSPALLIHPSSFKVIKDVFKGINEGCSNRRLVDRECGFHVHILANDLERKHFRNLLKWFWKLEPAIHSIIPPSRRDNEYVANLREQFDYRRINNLYVPGTDVDDDDDDRYDNDDIWDYSYGFDPWRHADSYKTIEVRYAASTSNPDKIINWIQLLIYLFEIGLEKQVTRTRNPNYKTICGLLDRNEIKYKFIENRAKQLQDWVVERYQQLRREDAA